MERLFRKPRDFSRPNVPPLGLVMLGVVSVQLGSALATHLFRSVQPGGATLFRLGFGALILLALWRPRLRDHSRSSLLLAVLFGVSVAAMNFSFYSAIARIPIGVAVTLEFVGPLGVAVAGSRRSLDLLWVVLAAAGILLLAPWGGFHLNALGVLLGLLAGGLWACYILLSARLGRAFSDGTGLSLAVAVGAIVVLPVGVATAGPKLLHPQVLALGIGLALLSSVIPYSAELEALRSLPTRVFGVLMSSEPAVAAIVGFIFLGQLLGARAIAALVLVTLAAAGAASYGQPEPSEIFP